MRRQAAPAISTSSKARDAAAAGIPGAREPDPVAGAALEFRRCDAGRPPASGLIDSVPDEYDVLAGRALSGGPSATPGDLAPPGGAFLVGFAAGVPACGCGVKALGGGAGEIEDYNDNPHAGHWGERRP